MDGQTAGGGLQAVRERAGGGCTRMAQYPHNQMLQICWANDMILYTRSFPRGTGARTLRDQLESEACVVLGAYNLHLVTPVTGQYALRVLRGAAHALNEEGAELRGAATSFSELGTPPLIDDRQLVCPSDP